MKGKRSSQKSSFRYPRRQLFRFRISCGEDLDGLREVPSSCKLFERLKAGRAELPVAWSLGLGMNTFPERTG